MADACCGPELSDEGPARIWQVRELQMAAVAAVLLGMAWLVDRSGGAGLLVTGIALAAAVVGASTFVPGALRSLRHGRIGVGTLMTIAAVGAVALGQVAEAALLGILFSIAEGLEHHAVTRTRRGLRALLGLVPPTASVLRAGREVVVAPDDLVVGDVLVLRPGERAATDGHIRAGRTSLDTSAITGESIPVEAGPGDELSPGASTVAAPSKSRSRPRPRTARWPGSCTSSKRHRNARAQASASRTGSPGPSSRDHDLGRAGRRGRCRVRRSAAVVGARAGRPGRGVPLCAGHLGAAHRRGGDRRRQQARRAGEGRRGAGRARPDPRGRTGQDRHADAQPTRSCRRGPAQG